MDRPGRKTYYEILQVHPQASHAVIQGAYRALLKNARAHPDLGGSDDGAKLINEAYSVLGNPERRRSYDRELFLAEPRRMPMPIVRTQYILICPACRKRNLVSDETLLNRTKCAACGQVLLPPRRVPLETDHAKAFRLGVYLFDKGLLPRALREFEAAARLNPRNAKYQYWLGRCLYQMRAFERSRQAFHTAALLRPGKFHFQFWLGQIHYALKDFGQALSDFTGALKARPGHGPTLLRLASCYFHLGQYRQAVRILEEAIRREPTRLRLYTLLGVVYLASRNPRAALQAFQHVERLHPGDRFARRYIDLIQES